MQLKEESNAALSAYEGELAWRERAQAIDAEAREKVNQAAVEARESLDDTRDSARRSGEQDRCQEQWQPFDTVGMRAS
jgi:hypothetical protein